MPRKLLTKHNFPSDIELRLKVYLLKVILENQNGLSLATITSYTKRLVFFNCIDTPLDTYSNYDNVLITGDFTEIEKVLKIMLIKKSTQAKLIIFNELCLSIFLYQHDLCNHVKVSTRFRNSSKATSFDLFLTIRNTHIQNTDVVYSDLSDFHEIVLTISKTSFDKIKYCEILYRNYKKFIS